MSYDHATVPLAEVGQRKVSTQACQFPSSSTRTQRMVLQSQSPHVINDGEAVLGGTRRQPLLAKLNTTIDLVLPDSGQLRAKRGEARVVSRPHV
jgi:hypothetical protein